MKPKITSKEAFNLLSLIYEKQDKEGLWLFVRDFFGIKIPRKAVCPNHDAPFDFVSDVFFGKVRNALAVANRTGGKTSNFAVLDVLNSYYFDDCETATVGAIETQAIKCYKYFQSWVTNIPIFQERLVSSLMRETSFKNKSSVQILTGTMQGVNAPHPQKVFLDEFELMTWNVIQEAFSMPHSKGDIPGQLIITSSRKFAFGPMEKMLDEAEERGFKIYRWCVMETVEKHDPVKCANSVFHEDCQGKCLECEGYLKLDDVISAKRRLDEDTWKSQWLCQKPMQTALVYPQFDVTKHVKRMEFDTGAELYLAEDFGFAQGHANVVGFWQVLPSGIAQMKDEIWIEHKTDSDIITLVEDKLVDHGFVKDKKRQDLLNKAVSVWYCPIEEPSKIELRRRVGYRVVAQADADARRVINGLPLVRKALQDKTLFFDPKCKRTIKEMSIYANKIRADGTILDEPNKKNDNGPDMVRYFFINHFPAKQGGHFRESKSEAKTITGGIADIEF